MRRSAKVNVLRMPPCPPPNTLLLACHHPAMQPAAPRCTLRPPGASPARSGLLTWLSTARAQCGADCGGADGRPQAVQMVLGGQNHGPGTLGHLPSSCAPSLRPPDTSAVYEGLTAADSSAPCGHVEPRATLDRTPPLGSPCAAMALACCPPQVSGTLAAPLRSPVPVTISGLEEGSSHEADARGEPCETMLMTSTLVG
jgi:hypothetical protein